MYICDFNNFLSHISKLYSVVQHLILTCSLLKRKLRGRKSNPIINKKQKSWHTLTYIFEDLYLRCANYKILIIETTKKVSKPPKKAKQVNQNLALVFPNQKINFLWLSIWGFKQPAYTNHDYKFDANVRLRWCIILYVWIVILTYILLHLK